MAEPNLQFSFLALFKIFLKFCLRAGREGCDFIPVQWQGSSTDSFTLPHRQAEHSVILLAAVPVLSWALLLSRALPAAPDRAWEQLTQKASCQRILFQLQHFSFLRASQTQSCSVCEGAGIEHLGKVRVKHINGGSTAHFIKIPNL